MAPRDGDENGPSRRPRPAVADGQGPAEWSDGEDDINEDNINQDDINDEDDDSEDGDENEDPVEYNGLILNVQLQEELRRMELRTENSELKAERMEAEVTLFEEQDETEKIREDIRRLEFQIQTLRGAQFG